MGTGFSACMHKEIFIIQLAYLWYKVALQVKNFKISTQFIQNFNPGIN